MWGASEIVRVLGNKPEAYGSEEPHDAALTPFKRRGGMLVSFRPLFARRPGLYEGSEACRCISAEIPCQPFTEESFLEMICEDYVPRRLVPEVGGAGLPKALAQESRVIRGSPRIQAPSSSLCYDPCKPNGSQHCRISPFLK